MGGPRADFADIINSRNVTRDHEMIRARIVETVEKSLADWMGEQRKFNARLHALAERLERLALSADPMSPGSLPSDDNSTSITRLEAAAARLESQNSEGGSDSPPTQDLSAALADVRDAVGALRELGANPLRTGWQAATGLRSPPPASDDDGYDSADGLGPSVPGVSWSQRLAALLARRRPPGTPESFERSHSSERAASPPPCAHFAHGHVDDDREPLDTSQSRASASSSQRRRRRKQKQAAKEGKAAPNEKSGPS